VLEDQGVSAFEASWDQLGQRQATACALGQTRHAATSPEGRVQVRRVYEEPEPEDGTRVLVDRIWPRGLTRAKAALDEWCKDVAPSGELRRWYGHDPGRFEEFGRRYRVELQGPRRRYPRKAGPSGLLASIRSRRRLVARQRRCGTVVPARQLIRTVRLGRTLAFPP
jgi:uncharacterized protein YeaO (DUF488 family)